MLGCSIEILIHPVEYLPQVFHRRVWFSKKLICWATPFEFMSPLCNILVQSTAEGVHISWEMASGPSYSKLLLPVWTVYCKSSIGEVWILIHWANVLLVGTNFAARNYMWPIHYVMVYVWRQENPTLNINYLWGLIIPVWLAEHHGYLQLDMVLSKHILPRKPQDHICLPLQTYPFRYIFLVFITWYNLSIICTLALLLTSALPSFIKNLHTSVWPLLDAANNGVCPSWNIIDIK